MEKRHRVFVAINLPNHINKELDKYQAKWPELPAKWVDKDNFHITLEFLGFLSDEEVGQTCQIVKEVALRHESFSLNLNQVTYGPPDKIPPKIVWAVGDKSEELTDLREDLENSLTEKIRFVPEERAFAPHVTLARLSALEWRGINPEERPEVNENINLEFTVESINVMESETRRGGPVYTVLESHELKS